MFVYPPICRLTAEEATRKPVAALADYVRVAPSTVAGAGNGLFAARALPRGVYAELDGFVRIQLTGVEERGHGLLYGTSFGACVAAAGLGAHDVDLAHVAHDLAHLQYAHMEPAEYERGMRLATLNAAGTRKGARFPLFTYGKVNVAVVVDYLLDASVRRGLDAMVRRSQFAPGHVDPCFFVQCTSVQELVWLFALCTEHGLGINDLVHVVALVFQNHFTAQEARIDREDVEVAYVAPLVCSANTVADPARVKCDITPVYGTPRGPLPLIELSARGEIVPAPIRHRGDLEALVGTALVVMRSVAAGEELFVDYSAGATDPEDRYRFVGELGASRNGFVWELLQPSCPSTVRRLAIAVLRHESMAGVRALARAWARAAGLDTALEAEL